MKCLWVTSGKVICLSPNGPLWYNYTDGPASSSWLHTGPEIGSDHNNGYIFQGWFKFTKFMKTDFTQFGSSVVLRGKKTTLLQQQLKLIRDQDGIFCHCEHHMLDCNEKVTWWIHCLRGSRFDIKLYKQKPWFYDSLTSERCFYGHRHCLHD